MQYYAKVGEIYYRLFSIRNGRGKERHNDYLKWSTVYDPIGRRKIAKEFTIHRHKIAIKTAYPQDDHGKNSSRGYETLHNFGFDNPKRSLVQLWRNNVSEGFVRQKSYQADHLKQNSEFILFPADPIRPYWISAYFTILSQVESENLFADENLDFILHYTSEFGNLLTLIKFVQPEWEILGVEPLNTASHWNHPLFHLSREYT